MDTTTTELVTKSYLYEGIAIPLLIGTIALLGAAAFFFAKAWLKSQNTILDTKFTTFQTNINNTIITGIANLKKDLEKEYASKALVDDLIKRIDKIDREILTKK